MKTLENVHFKHFHCPNCEKRNIPTKKQAGITLHALILLKTDDVSAYFNACCMVCEAEPNKNNPKLMNINKSRSKIIPIKEWNALMGLKVGDDGFVD